MFLFKDKTLINIESILKNPKANLSEKIDALTQYFPYLREKKDTKKEGEVFMGIINTFKDKNCKQIYIGKDLLFFNDRKNYRTLLNAEFLKVMNIFTSTQMMVFASMMETLEQCLDFFINENGLKLRFDFKNIVPIESIDLELFKKRSNIEANTQITKFLSSKNIFIFDGIFIKNSLPLDSKFFYDMMPYMGEKLYPVLYKNEEEIVVDYLDVREIERRIKDNSTYMPFGYFLENLTDLKINLENRIITIPITLLNRNSNFYIFQEKKKGLFGN